MVLPFPPLHDGVMIESSFEAPPLTRASTGRLVAGVAAGFAAIAGINAWWIRGGFLVLVPFGGLGVVLYLACWLVIPPEGGRSVAARLATRLGRGSRTARIGVVFIGLAGFVLLSGFSLISTRVLLAGSLFVVGSILYQSSRLG